MKILSILLRATVLIITILVLAMAAAAAIPTASPSGDDRAKAIGAAKAELQAGINAWSGERLAKARDLFLGLAARSSRPDPLLSYYLALADYRLAVFHLAANASAEADRYVAESQQYLQKAVEADPGFGEALALQGFMLGLEVGLHPDRAMDIGFRGLGLIDAGLEKAPDNPRVHLLKGLYLAYLPEAYGGGLKVSIPELEKAVELFAKDKPADETRPDWGLDEALLGVGIAYQRQGDAAKAREFYNRALTANPANGYAQTLLKSLSK